MWTRVGHPGQIGWWLGERPRLCRTGPAGIERDIEKMWVVHVGLNSKRSVLYYSFGVCLFPFLPSPFHSWKERSQEAKLFRTLNCHSSCNLTRCPYLYLSRRAFRDVDAFVNILLVKKKRMSLRGVQYWMSTGQRTVHRPGGGGLGGVHKRGCTSAHLRICSTAYRRLFVFPIPGIRTQEAWWCVSALNCERARAKDQPMCP